MRRPVLLALLLVPCTLVSQGAADEPGISGYVLAPDDVPVSGGTVVSARVFSRNLRIRPPHIQRLDRTGIDRLAASCPVHGHVSDRACQRRRGHHASPGDDIRVQLGPVADEDVYGETLVCPTG